MANRPRGRIDLSIGGDSWAGFTFGSYGKAREWRISTPNGQALTAGDLLHVHANALDLGYLQVRNRELEAKQAGVTFALTPDESHLVRVALQVLARELPVQLGRRDARVKPEMLLRAV